MKVLIYLISVSFASALPAGGAGLLKDIPIISLENDIAEDGKFHYSYETGNGIKARQQGELHVINKDVTVQVVKGEYSFDSPEGEKVSISYVADENGFHPTGSHVPVAPPVPDLIVRALKYIAEHPYVEPKSKTF